MKNIGMARLVGPMMAKFIRVFLSVGHADLWYSATAVAVSAPNSMRKATSDVGPISRTPILIQRKDELQIRPSVMKAIQCFVFNPLLVQLLKHKRHKIDKGSNFSR